LLLCCIARGDKRYSFTPRALDALAH